MKDLFQFGAELETWFHSKDWRFCFIGGIALHRWGEPRLTRDLDVSLLTEFGSEALYIDELLARFPSRLPDARAFALKRRVLLLASKNGVPFDIALAGFPFEEEMVARASPFVFLPDVSLTVCSAEDLVIHKAFANRTRDWADIESILWRQKALNWTLIQENLKPLAEIKETPEILSRLEEVRKQIEGARDRQPIAS